MLSFPVAYFIVAASVRNLFFRYAIQLVPFLCVTAAWLVTRSLSTVWRSSRFSGALAAAVAALIVLPSAASSVQFDRVASRTDNRVVVAQWFDGHVPAGSTVLMSGSAYGYVQFTREKNYRAWLWDRQRLMFVTFPDNRPAVGRPEYVLLQESPLPNETQPEVTDLLKSDYVMVQRFQAFTPGEARVYDLQDAFFIPFSGFEGVERPGPNYTLYKRADNGP